MRKALWFLAVLLAFASCTLPNPIPGELLAVGVFVVGGCFEGRAA